MLLTSFVAFGDAEKKKHCQVWQAKCEGPGAPFKTTNANLDCEFVKTYFFPFFEFFVFGFDS